MRPVYRGRRACWCHLCRSSVYWAARHARRSILISGWEFDSGVPLLRGADAPAGAEVRLLKFLNGLCERNPKLYVCLLAWDFHIVLAGEREWLQRVFFHWMTHSHLHFRVDDAPVAGGSHHQKFVVIDGRLAFLGGMDLRDACWDDRRHLTLNPDRSSRGRLHKPYHDVQAYMAGGAAPLVLERYFFERWKIAGGGKPPLEPPLLGGGDFQARSVLPLGPARIGLSRTQPRARGPAVREALVRRMRETQRPRLEIVVVVNERAEAIKEEIAVGLRQLQNIEELRAVAAETGTALGCYDSCAAGPREDGERVPTYIHSKVLIVDDRFLTVGSANMTNRSMGIDSELHASWEASDANPGLEDGIRRVRVDLLAEHAGIAAPRDLDVLASINGLVGRLDAIAGRPGARLQRHGAPSAAQRKLLAVLDPDALPFDSDGREPADEHSRRTPRMALRRVGAALWDRVARVRRPAA